MSIARAAAKAMLSDALLQEGPAINRLSHLELELPLDKVIKFVSVGLPLVLVCMAFAREISLGEPHSLSLHLHVIYIYIYIYIGIYIYRNIYRNIYRYVHRYGWHFTVLLKSYGLCF